MLRMKTPTSNRNRGEKVTKTSATETTSKRRICSVCGGPIPIELATGWTGGRNAYPLTNGRCCPDCDGYYVIATRGILNAIRERAQAGKSIRLQFV